MSEPLISFDTMVEPIERFFEREFPNPIGSIYNLTFQQEAPILAYLEKGVNGLHLVRFEELYDDAIFSVFRGIHALSCLTANFRWIALPLDEFREGEDDFCKIMERETQRRGLGIIAVQQKGRGISAKVIVRPKLLSGNFLGQQSELYKQWRNIDRRPGSYEGYQVVDFY